MNEHLIVLRRVGLALVIVGVLDIGYMAYCITNNQSYSSSLNIFAVIAGIFLIRGSLQATRILTWFCAFLLAGVLGATLLILPFIQPFGLWAMEYRLNPTSMVLLVLSLSATITFLFWVYKQLRSPSVMQARVAAGQLPSPPYAAFFFGIALAIGSAAMVNFTINGESGAKAVQQLAQEQHGPGFKYHVTAMSWSRDRYSTSDTAYSQIEIKSVM